MNKRLIIIIGSSLLLLLIAGFSLYAVMDESGPDQEKRTTNPISTGSDDSSETDVKTGRTILIDRFDVAFALPERIDVTDIRIIYKSTDKYDVAVIASKTLASKLDKDQCWGGTLEMGSFAEITRYETAGDNKNVREVGDAYYRIDEGPAYSNCYDAVTFEKYYGPDVVEAIESTLVAR